MIWDLPSTSRPVDAVTLWSVRPGSMLITPAARQPSPSAPSAPPTEGQYVIAPAPARVRRKAPAAPGGSAGRAVVGTCMLGELGGSAGRGGFASGALAVLHLWGEGAPW